MASLDLINVQKSFGPVKILHDISIGLQDGEFLVLVGPSGCGKSTLMNIIAGLEEPSGGQLRLQGRDITDIAPAERNISMVFQSYALYPNMTVAKNIEFPLEMRKVEKTKRDERVKAVSKLLQIEHLLERKPRQLSGGQRQRVAMGRAIVREPAVFLFDEPLSNLDAKLRVQMRFEIQKLHRRLSTTSLYVTHDQVEAMTLAQRMIVMNAGRAEQIGTPMEVYENPASVFVAGFIGSPAMNFLGGKAETDGRVTLDGGGAVAAGGKLEPGRRITVGVRPEHFTPCVPSAANLVGSVEMIEALGADTLIHVAFGGASLIARLPHGAPATVGEPIALAAAPGRVYLFDAETGARVAA